MGAFPAAFARRGEVDAQIGGGQPVIGRPSPQAAARIGPRLALFLQAKADAVIGKAQAQFGPIAQPQGIGGADIVGTEPVRCRRRGRHAERRCREGQQNPERLPETMQAAHSDSGSGGRIPGSKCRCLEPQPARAGRRPLGQRAEQQTDGRPHDQLRPQRGDPELPQHDRRELPGTSFTLGNSRLTAITTTR